MRRPVRRWKVTRVPVPARALIRIGSDHPFWTGGELPDCTGAIVEIHLAESVANSTEYPRLLERIDAWLRASAANDVIRTNSAAPIVGQGDEHEFRGRSSIREVVSEMLGEVNADVADPLLVADFVEKHLTKEGL